MREFLLHLHRRVRLARHLRHNFYQLADALRGDNCRDLRERERAVALVWHLETRHYRETFHLARRLLAH